MFKSYGPIFRCFIKKKNSRNPSKKGYVRFRKEEDYNVVRALRFIKLKGHKISILKSKPGEDNSSIQNINQDRKFVLEDAEVHPFSARRIEDRVGFIESDY